MNDRSAGRTFQAEEKAHADALGGQEPGTLKSRRVGEPWGQWDSRR